MKKQLIISAYMELTKECGSIQDISIKQIADKAGIGKGTIYEYFKSKDEIVKSLLEFMIDKITSIFIEKIDYTGLDYDNSLKKFIEDIHEGAVMVNEMFMYNQHNMHDIAKIVDMKEVLITKFKSFYIKNIRLFRENIYNKGVDEGIVEDQIDDIDLLIIIKTIYREITENLEFQIIDIESIKNKLYNNTYKLLKK